MLTNNSSFLDRLVFLRLIACLLFLFGAAASQAYGQTSYWSDNWLIAPPPDDNPTDDPDDFPAYVPGAYVRASGITEDYYGSYGHENNVSTTITGPNGRTSTGSGGGGSYVRADVGLQLTDDDVGLFGTESWHETVCPYYNMGMQPVSSIAAGVGVGLSAYRFGGVVPPAFVSGSLTLVTRYARRNTLLTWSAAYATRRGIYRQCMDGYYYGYCLTRRVVCAGRVMPGFCVDG